TPPAGPDIAKVVRVFIVRSLKLGTTNFETGGTAVVEAANNKTSDSGNIEISPWLTIRRGKPRLYEAVNLNEACPRQPRVADESLGADQGRLSVVNRMPRGCGLQLAVDVVNILHALAFQPFAERGGALLGIDRNTLFPGGASTKNAVEFHSGFPRQFERLAEFGVAHPSREINERLGRNVGSLMKQVDGFFLRVCLLASKRFRALDEFHVHRHFDFEHVDTVARFAELPHTLSDDLRFLPGVLEALLVRTFLVADKLEEVGDVIGAALIADALDPGVLFVVHVLGIVGSVVEQNLDAVC